MLVPTGVYRARAVEAELCAMSEGTEHVHVLFEIVEGDHEGEFLPWFGFFRDVTAKRTVESLRFCGWRGCDLTDLGGVTDDEVEITVDHWLREGRTFARVGEVRHGSRLLAAEAMSSERASAFAERMRGFISALRHRGAVAAVEAPAPGGGDTQRIERVGARCLTMKARSLGDEIVPF